MNVHEICVFCKYRGESACSDKQHRLLFRPDNVDATFSYYNAQPFDLPVDEVTKNRITDCVHRFDGVVRFQDETYGLAGIILLLESILEVNTAHYQSLITTGQNPPTAVQIRPDYPVRPPQQTASFNNSLVSTSSAQQPQRQPCPACIYLATNCPWNCQLAQYFGSIFQENFRDEFRSLFARTSLVNNPSQKKLKPVEKKQIRDNTIGFDFAILNRCHIYGTTGIMLSLVRRLLAVNSDIDNLEGVNHLRQLVLQHGQHHQQEPPEYPAPTNLNTGRPPQQQHRRQLQLGVAKRSLEQGESQISQQRPRLPRPPYKQAGPRPRLPRPPYQRAGPRPRLPRPPYQRAGAGPRPQPEIPLLDPALPQPRLQQPVRFPYHPAAFQQPYPPAAFQQPYPPAAFQQPYPPAAFQQPYPPAAFQQPYPPAAFQQPYPPAAFQQPSYHVQMQGYEAGPLLQSQLPAMPSQSDQLLAGINSSSTATSSQSQFQSQQQHYFSTVSSSSAAVVGQPDPHHQPPPLEEVQNAYWEEEQIKFSQRLQPMQGYQARKLLQSQLPAMPSQSEQLLAGINSSSTATSSQSQFQSQSQSQQQHYFSTVSSSSAAVVGQPDPHHQPPPLEEVQNAYWEEEQIKFSQRLQPMQGYQARPLLQSQLPAMPSQSEQLLAGINSSSSATSSQSQQQLAGSSSSAAVVGHPHQHHHAPADPCEFATMQLPDNEITDEAQKQLNQGPQ
ncbi:hypothetical protein MKX03_018017 [Papaver bracteatum]|nr:hypothetical protein MKX03_018017 [Papaver bracteatum]